MSSPAAPDLPAGPPGCKGWPWEPPGETGAQDADVRTAWPRITVVTPSFNQGAYLEAALRSVLLQSYPNLEYIVMDGGSDDHSVEILQRYGPQLAHWQSMADSGQADAIASGFARATGEIYGYLNSDDLLLPGALRHVARMFIRWSSVGVVYGNRLVVDEHGAVIGRHVWPYFLSRYHWATGQPLAQECCFWRSDVYWGVGGIDRSKFFIMDYDLFYRMWRAARFRKTRAYLGALRVHGESKNALHGDVWQRELAAAKAHYALREPGYFRARVINRLDRMQLLFDALAERACGSRLPGIE
jgi:glycosyltransferase involved in cell wall biosynthesis